MMVFGVAAVLIALAFVGYQLIGSPKPGPAGVTVAANSTDRASPAGRGSGGSPDAARSARAAASPGPSGAASPQAGPSQSATPAAPPAQPRPHSLPVVSAAAFGARGGMGQGDDPQDARLAIDGVRGTAWHTDWYTTALFGNLYAGTGLIVDMGRPVTITSVRLTLGPAAGAHVAIRVGDRPVLADMPRVARSAGPGGVIRMTLARPAKGRYLLVWFTRLPPDPAGTYKAEIYGIGVKGLTGPGPGLPPGPGNSQPPQRTAPPYSSHGERIIGDREPGGTAQGHEPRPGDRPHRPGPVAGLTGSARTSPS